MINKAIYPGTFDPITNGHLDIATRAAKIFDQIILAVSDNSNKHPLFNFHERIYFANQATSHLSNILVIGFNELVVELAKKEKAKILIRSIRTTIDFEYEMQLAKINKNLMSTIETIFMVPSEPWSYISSSSVKEIAKMGGNVNRFLPPIIARAVCTKLCS